MSHKTPSSLELNQKLNAFPEGSVSWQTERRLIWILNELARQYGPADVHRLAQGIHQEAQIARLRGDGAEGL